MATPRRTPLDWIRRGLLAIGLVCLGTWGWATADGLLYRHQQNQRLDRILAARAEAEPAAGRAPGEGWELATGGVERVAVKRPGHRSPANRAASKPDRDRRDQLPPVEATSPIFGSDAATRYSRRPEPARAAADEELLGRLEMPRIGLSTIVSAASGSRALRRSAAHIAGTARPGERGNVGIAGHRDSTFQALRFAAPGDLVVLASPDATRRYRVEWVRVVDPDYVEVLEPAGGETLTLVTCYPFSYFGAAPRRYVVRARRLPADGATQNASIDGPAIGSR